MIKQSRAFRRIREVHVYQHSRHPRGPSFPSSKPSLLPIKPSFLPTKPSLLPTKPSLLPSSPLSFHPSSHLAFHQAISPSQSSVSFPQAISVSSRSFQVLPGSLAARQYLRLSSPIFFQLSFPLSTIQHSLPLSLPILPPDLAPSYNGDDSLGSMADAALHHFTPRHHFLWINSVTVGIRAARASMLLHLPLQR